MNEMQEGTTMAEWFTAKTLGGWEYGIVPDDNHTISIIGNLNQMSVSAVASLHEELGKLIEGKIEKTDEDGWRYLT